MNSITMASQPSINKLQQQLRSAQGRLRAQSNAIKDTDYRTVLNQVVTFTPATAVNPATTSILFDGSCGSNWTGVVAPAEFVRHWSQHLPLTNGRVVIQTAFVCEITAGPYCDIAVDPTCMSPNTQANDGVNRAGGNFHVPPLLIPKGTTVKVTFSLLGKQTTIPQCKKHHKKRLQAGTINGVKPAYNRTIYERLRNTRRRETQWLAEVQDEPLTPIYPGFCLYFDDDSLEISPFRHGTVQPYTVATIKWCSLHYLAV